MDSLSVPSLTFSIPIEYINDGIVITIERPGVNTDAESTKEIGFQAEEID